LESSVGKTYFSNKFCVINSKLYDRTELGWVERPHLNPGLLFGQSKSGLKGEKTLANIGCVHRELMKTCPDIVKQAASDSFLRIHEKLLKKLDNLGYRTKWFLPEWMGGLGLSSEFHTITYYDRALAFEMRKQISNGLIKIEELKCPDQWQMHKLILKRYFSQVNWLGECHFKNLIYDNVDMNIEEEYNRIYKFLTLALLFDKSVSFGDLQKNLTDESKNEVEKENFRKAIENSRKFSKVAAEMRSRNINHLMSEEEISFLDPFRRFLPIFSEKLPELQAL
jgi:hypothetical protein